MMNDVHSFEQQLARSLDQLAGPRRAVDAMAISRAAVTQSPKWRFRSMLSAAELVAAGVLMAVFGGFLAAGMVSPSPDRLAAPAAVGTGEPASSFAPSPCVSPVATVEIYEATARLTVDPGPAPSVQDMALAKVALNRYAAMTETRSVAEAVIAGLGLDESAESLLGRISTTTSDDGLLLSIRVRDDDPEAARALALAIGEEMRAYARDVVVTDEVKQAETAIRQASRSISTLQVRLNRLLAKSNKTRADWNEIAGLNAQIASLRDDIVRYQSSSREQVGNRLEWFGSEPVPEPVAPGETQEALIPTKDVVVAARMIEHGTSIAREMLTLRTVPVDATNEMALTDLRSVLGREAAIDILANQAISPNMLVTR